MRMQISVRSYKKTVGTIIVNHTCMCKYVHEYMLVYVYATVRVYDWRKEAGCSQRHASHYNHMSEYRSIHVQI